MFDFAWSEIALIGVVALVAIGPKDMPVAIRTLSELVKKARRMAGEFQTHVDEMVREANLGEVRDHFNDIRSLNLRGQIAKAIDGDGVLRRTFTENPLAASAPVVPAAVAGSDAIPLSAPEAAAAPDQVDAAPVPAVTDAVDHVASPVAATDAGWSTPVAAPEAVARGSSSAPAFIPPANAARPPRPVPPRRVPPAFIPPAAAAELAGGLPAAR